MKIKFEKKLSSGPCLSDYFIHSQLLKLKIVKKALSLIEQFFNAQGNNKLVSLPRRC